MIDMPSKKMHGKIKDINGVEKKFNIIKEVRRVQSDYPDKVFVLQLLHFPDRNKEEIRIGYYIKGKKPKMLGKWVWGQFCPFFPKEDLKELLRDAQKEGIITA